MNNLIVLDGVIAWRPFKVMTPLTGQIKTILGIDLASVKTWNDLAIASVKTWNGLPL